MKAKQITEKELSTFLEAHEWVKDRWGHYQKEVTRLRPHVDKPEGELITTLFRAKLQAISCRLETRVKSSSWPGQSAAKNEWVKCGGSYYKDIEKLEDGRLRIGTRLLGSKGGL